MRGTDNGKTMSARFRTLALLIGVGGVCLVAWLSSRGPQPPYAQPGHQAEREGPDSGRDGPESTTPQAGTTSPPAGSSTRSVKVIGQIQALAGRLKSDLSPEDARNQLVALRDALRALSPEEAVAALSAALELQLDASTKLDFLLDRAGHMKEAPSLRVWLLDCLGEISREAAADYAATILSSSSSPDEWAISLRDYALVRTSSSEQEFVRNKVRELIWNEQWQAKPSAGYLEAFDTIVYTKATELTPDLAQLVKTRENPAVAHAAYLAMDRLVLEEPAKVLSQLASNPGFMNGREQTRANYFARADVRDPEQRAILQRYLLDPSRISEELRTFGGIYPNANLMISTNLLSRSEAPARSEIIAHDREALMVVEEWLGDQRFDSIRETLEHIHSRLRNFVNQAEAQ
jgi:hypothetical protein